MVHPDVREYVERDIEAAEEGWVEVLGDIASPFFEQYPETDATIGDLIVGLIELEDAEVRRQTEYPSQTELTDAGPRMYGGLETVGIWRTTSPDVSD